MHLTGYRHQGFYGRSYTPSKNISMPDLLSRYAYLIFVLNTEIYRFLKVKRTGTRASWDARHVPCTSVPVILTRQKLHEPLLPLQVRCFL